MSVRNRTEPIDRSPRSLTGLREPHVGNESTPAVYTVREVARLLDLAPGTTYELLRAGEIPGRRVGRRWLISRALFHEWIDASPGRAGGVGSPAPVSGGAA